jgi:hypothetical protein
MLRLAGWHSGILQALGSILASASAIPTGFPWICSVPSGKCWGSILIKPLPFSSKSFPIYHFSAILPYKVL